MIGEKNMLQVSRDGNLKIPKKIENINVNSIEDKLAVKQAIAIAKNEKFNKNDVEEKT